jgi:hypothetical protein
MQTLKRRTFKWVGCVLVLLVPTSLAGCANTVIYTHTTTVTASAQELDIEAPGIVPDVHVKDGMVEVSITTEIAISSTKVFVSNEVYKSP